MRKLLSRISGFTLLELLVVVALMAVVAAVALVANDGVQDEAAVDATKYEMAELRKALLQFRRDTGVFPCGVYNEARRPYGLHSTDAANDGETNRPFMLKLEAEAPILKTTTFPVAGSTRADRQEWCRTEGLKMLLGFPFDEWDTTNSYTLEIETLHPLWNLDVKRGWHGPYLSSREGLKDAWGNPYYLQSPELSHSAGAGSVRCDLSSTASSTFSQCRGTDSATAAHTTPGDLARIVSAGPNGVYESGYPDGFFAGSIDWDVVNPCEPVDGTDDLVLCLLK